MSYMKQMDQIKQKLISFPICTKEISNKPKFKKKYHALLKQGLSLNSRNLHGEVMGWDSECESRDHKPHKH